MPADLNVTLAAFSDGDLVRLRELADDATGPTAGLLAAISHAADHELHRRSGVDFDRLPLTQAIADADLDAALALTVALADRLGDVPGIRALLGAVVAEITEAHQRH